jgi:hypothetical protein
LDGKAVKIVPATAVLMLVELSDGSTIRRHRRWPVPRG